MGQISALRARLAAVGVGMALTTGLLAATTSAQAAPAPHPGPQPSARDQAISSAHDRARTEKRSVTVDALTTATQMVSVNPAGTVTEQVSPVPVRFQDAAGAWQPINLNLVAGRNGTEAPASAPASAGRLSGNAASLPVQVTSAAGPISFGPTAAAPVAPALAGRTATFPGALPGGRTVTEQPLIDGAEESAVLPSATAGGTWDDTFRVPAGVKAENTASGVTFVDAHGTPVGAYHDGEATDSAADPADAAVTVAVKGTAGDRVTVTVSVDPTWLADPARVFPVTVDPTYTGTTTANGSDAYVDAHFPTTAEGSNDPTNLKVGLSSPYVTRSYLQFNGLPTDGTHDPISGATLQVWNYYSSACLAANQTGHPVLSAFEAASNWSASTVTWNNQPNPASGAPTASEAAAVGHGADCPAAYLTVPVTSLVQDWANGGHADHGFELGTNESDPSGWKKFNSGEDANPPILTYSYSITPTFPDVLYGVACPPGATVQSDCYSVGDVSEDNGDTSTGQSEAVAVSAGGTKISGANAIAVGKADTQDASDIACPTTTLCLVTLTDFSGTSPAGSVVPLTVNGASISAGTPVPVGIANPQSITCPSATTCAVGGTNAAGTAGQTTTVTISGSTVTGGSPVATIPGMDAVAALSCSSATSCLVGGSHDPDPKNESQSLVGSLASVNPTVGITGGPTTATPVPGVAAVLGIACPSATSCEAVGFSQSSHGVVVPVSVSGTSDTPGSANVLLNTDELDDVSCVGDDCEAVGDTLAPDDETGNSVGVPIVGGTVGAVRSLNDGGELPGVSCVSATACVGVGYLATDTDFSGEVVALNPTGSPSTNAPGPYCTAPYSGGTDDIVATTETADGGGYWMTDDVGDVIACGDAASDFGTVPDTLTKPIVGILAGPDDNGFWLVASDGGIFSEGDVGFYGSAGALKLTKPVVGGVTTADGKGYWLVASDGGIFNYGDAAFEGSAGALKLTKPVVGMAASHDGKGYWLVASDGGIFNYGDAPFEGSAGNIKLTKPVVGMAPDDTGNGYWLDASDGGIFTYGDANFAGSAGGLKLTQPVIGMGHPKGSAGYQLVAADGGIFSYGAPFYGSGNPIWTESGDDDFADARPAAAHALHTQARRPQGRTVPRPTR